MSCLFSRQAWLAIIISFIWGLGIAATLAGISPLLYLGEMAGPKSFFIPIFGLSMLGLITMAFTSRVVGGRLGALCGVVFTCPIAIACYFIATYNPIVLRMHGLELGKACYLTLVVSIAVMAFRGKTNAWAKNDRNEP